MLTYNTDPNNWINFFAPKSVSKRPACKMYPVVSKLLWSTILADIFNWTEFKKDYYWLFHGVIFINQNTSILGLLCSCQVETCLFVIQHLFFSWTLPPSNNIFLHLCVRSGVGSSSPAVSKTGKQWGVRWTAL